MARVFKIAGAGPSGLSCAIGLSRLGEKAIVFEKNRSVGARFHDSFQFLENFSQREDVLSSLRRMGIKKNFDCTPFRRITLLDNNLKETVVSSSKPFWHLVRRGSAPGALDSGLLEQAQDAGAKVVFGKAVGASRADFLATGPSRADGVAKEMVFDCDQDFGHILLDDSVAPKGYSYVFSAGGKATFCIAIMRDFKNLDAYFRKSLEKIRRATGFKEKKPFFQTNFVSFCFRKTLSEGNRPLVGEAAGFQDALFGFGLRYALESGFLSAQSAVGRLDYARSARERLFPPMKASVANRFLFELGGNFGYRQAIRAASLSGDYRNFLYGLSKPSLFKRVFAQTIMGSVWRKKPCRHGGNCAWCLART